MKAKPTDKRNVRCENQNTNKGAGWGLKAKCNFGRIRCENQNTHLGGWVGGE